MNFRFHRRRSRNQQSELILIAYEKKSTAALGGALR
jgi:hypothetical protein